MELRLYEVYGLPPHEMDLLTYREMLMMLSAARERERSQMRASAEVVAAIYNFGGMVVPKQPLTPSDLYPDLYPGARAAKRREQTRLQEAGQRAHEYYKHLIESGARIVTLGHGRRAESGTENAKPAAPMMPPPRVMRGRRR